MQAALAMYSIRAVCNYIAILARQFREVGPYVLIEVWAPAGCRAESLELTWNTEQKNFFCSLQPQLSCVFLHPLALAMGHSARPGARYTATVIFNGQRPPRGSRPLQARGVDPGRQARRRRAACFPPRPRPCCPRAPWRALEQARTYMGAGW